MRRRDLDANVQLSMRIKEKLRRQLADAAAKHENSLNQEIKMRLEKSFEDETKQSLESIVSSIEGRFSTGIERFDNLTIRLTEALNQSKRGTTSPPREERGKK
jgi:hypothetical protein